MFSCHLAILTLAGWTLPGLVQGQGLILQLNEQDYTNNSEIPISDVGEGNAALLCRTDLTGCCNTPGQGEWFFPNNTMVGLRGGNGDLYRNRGTGFVRLNRRNNAMQPGGLYCCEVATMGDPNARICVTLISPPLMVTVSGSGDMQIAGEDYTLTCQITGGETLTTAYQWLKNSEPLSSFISSTLSFSPLRESSSGVYTCKGTRGTMTVTSTPGVTLTVVTPQLSAVITVTGQSREGQIYSLTCAVRGDESLDVNSRSLRWDKGSTEFSRSPTITFNPLQLSDAAVYRCTSTIDSPYLIGTRTVTTTMEITVMALPLTVSVSGNEGMQRVGESHALTCQVTGGGTTTPTYRWFRDGSPLTGQTSATLSFSPVRESSSGVYTCEGTRGGMTVTSPTGVRITAILPDLSTEITANREPDEGRSYTLTCTLRGAESLNANNMSQRWDKNNVEFSRENPLTFNPLQPSDAGVYKCTISFLSPYTNARDSGTGTLTVTVNRLTISNFRVTAPTATTLPISWTASGPIDRFEVTYSYTVNRCSAPSVSSGPISINSASRSHTLRDLNEDSTYSITVRVINTGASASVSKTGVQTTVAAPSNPGLLSFSNVNLTSITVQWTELPCIDRNGEITGYTVDYSSTTPSDTNTITVSGLSNTRLVVGGLLPRTSYTFSVMAQGPAGTSDSATETITTDTPTELQFYLRGTFLGNNSEVSIGDIGEGRAALYCLTNRVLCCSSAAGGRRGAWRYDGSNIAEGDANFPWTRGLSSLILSRVSNAMGPTGVYTCLIPDEGNVLMTLVVSVIPGGALNVSLSYDPTSHILTCLSSGRPVTVDDVTWRRNSVMISSSSKYLVGPTATIDNIAFIYHHPLNITSSIAQDYVGSFTCTVRSASSPPLSIEGTRISGNESVHQVRSVVNLTCSSDLAVQTIRWTDANGQELASNSGEQQLLLPIVVNSTDLNSAIYTCEVQAVLANNQFGVVSGTATLQINATVPTRLPMPGSVRNVSITSSSVRIEWELREIFVFSHPEVFTVVFGTDGANLNQRSREITATTSQMYSIEITSLDPATEYHYRIESRNGVETLEADQVYSFRTDDSTSDEVTNLANQINGSTLFISWEPPVNPNGEILNYSISVVNLSDGGMIAVSQGNPLTTNFTLVDLVPGVPYNVSIAAVNMAGLGEFTTLIYFIEELKPLISPKNVTVNRPSATVLVVSWIPLTIVESRGFISNYTVEYTSVTARKRQALDTMTQTVPGMDANMAMIEGIDAGVDYSVQVFANNGAASSDKSAAMVARVPVVPESPVSGGGGSGVVIGVVVAILLAIIVVTILVIIIAVLILKRRGKFTPQSSSEPVHYYMDKRRPSDSKPRRASDSKPKKPDAFTAKALEANNGDPLDEQTYENTVFMVKDRLKPIPVEDFGAHVQRMHADRDKWFELEYNAIEKSPQSDHEVSKHSENRARNRFGNIFPYDFNRVVLKTLPGEEHSDYINASFIDGYQRKQMYIGSQGPTENSLEDFWRMIWEQRVPTVVMLTRIYEGKKKCEMYWPESADEPFIPSAGSPLSIEYKSVLPFAEFVIRKMVVTNSDDPDAPPFEVTLFHYLGWPDHGVPTNAISMINFIKRVRKAHPYSRQDLLLVHCSAGVGRTGTFITLDSMLQRTKKENTLNIYEFVCSLRKQRVLMVQTATQYIFIHNALDELITCGETEIAAANMRIVIGKLSRVLPPRSITGFQLQYETLCKVTTDILNVDTSNATNDVNTPKNRYEDKIPYNHTRVRLRPSAAQGSDYINASFIDGYRQKGAYIATQGPLPHTVNDFWRMVWEQEVKCIVMLCKTEEKGTEVCSRYWPEGRGASESYGKYVVTFTKQEVCGDYVVRKLTISENQSRMSISSSGFTVTQFQYMKWPEDSVPQSTTGILEVANLVQKVQMSSGNKAIVVMCNDGVGRTGAFISTHAEMERMKAETVVDLFQFIKAARVQRRGLILNTEQYHFCHQVLADFLDGFDTYANFKEII